MHEFSFLGLIGGLLLTWIIGLTPPFVLRYLVIEKPLSNVWAISVCGLLWIVNMIIFIALGSKSKTHTALLLIALVSYWILHREPKTGKS